MRFIFRWMRRGLTAIFVLGILAGSGYFLYFTTTRIVEEVEFRREQVRRDQERQKTATMFAPTVEAVANQLVAYRIMQDSPDEKSVDAIEAAEASEEAQTDAVASNPDQGASLEMAVSSPETHLAEESMDSAVGVSQASEPTSTSTEVVPTVTRSEIVASASPTEAESPTVSVTPSLEPTAVAQEPTSSSTELPSATPFPTNTSLPTGIPTNTPLPSSTPSATNTETPSPTLTPSLTPTASDTPTPTLTFTPSPSPTPTYVIQGTYAVPVNTPIVPIHYRAPLLEDDPEIINVVLLGSDTSTGGIGQTDVIILVNINMKAESVAMWHLPRDLLVYIPDYTIDRINRAFAVGRDWPGGPAELMKETILYNFGIEVDYYARVDFTDFQSIVEQLGGLTISVDCAIEDWRLVDPANTPSEAYNPDPEVWGPYWEQFTLNQGVHTLSPYMALWYARSRVTTNDFDRGRRQIDILRAMWQQARDQGIFSQIETIQAGLEVVDTDMELDDILRLIPLATSIDLSDVERYSLEQNVHVETWLTPDDGRSVQRPNWPAILRLAQQFVTPPTDNRLSREAKVIEVIDATWYGLGWDRVAADRMAWEGFVPSITETRDIARHEITLIYDYTGEEKGSELERLQEILRVGDSQIRIDADPNRTVDYRVVVGESYNACYYSTSADDIPEAPSEVSE